MTGGKSMGDNIQPQSDNKAGPVKRKLVLAAALVMIGVAAVVAEQARAYLDYINSPEPGLKAEVALVIDPGMNFHEVEDALLQKGAVSNRTWFNLSARFKGLTTRIQAGEYTLKPGMTPIRILDLITRGSITTMKLIVPEGFSVFDVARRLDSMGPWSEERFYALAIDKKKTEALEVPVQTLEGYLFPAVYELTMSMTEEDIIDMMIRRGLKEKTLERMGLAKKIGLSWHQVLTMASMIEKETAIKDEAATIAGVFMKRLEKDMPLQSDPTAVYGVKDFKGPVKKSDLSRPGPYNTYLHKGLPPGPVCNPGKDAIIAALNPEDTDFLYFVATGDGGHVFAKTYLEHRKNIKEYRKRLKRGK